MNTAGALDPITDEHPVLLQSFGSVWRFFELYPGSMAVRRVPIWRTLVGRTDLVPRGWFGTIGGTPVALYLRGGNLNLLAGNKVLPIEETMTARLAEQGETRVLTINVGARCEVTVSYRRPKPWPALDGDLTAGIEEEQHDYGLFLRNVIEDRDRQHRLGRQLSRSA